MTRRLALALLCLPALAFADEFPIPQVDFGAWRPPVYPCVRTETAPAIDGIPNEAVWRSAAWTADFVDIEGNLQPAPRFRTRVKMLWDDECFYVAAELEEPHLWATLTQRDAVIYHDNDFELFIDPDGDTHDYYELEINALGTVWDLLLTRPYRDGGHAVDAWDIAGLKSAVHLYGSLNDPSDTDRGWSVELALPWSVLEECARHGGPPEPGECWRVNFSRVQWRLDVADGRYVKSTDTSGGILPENNWVWSPQGLVAMHYPEMWGCVLFSERNRRPDRAGMARVASRHGLHPLRLVYYAQKHHFALRNEYAADLAAIDALPARDWSRMSGGIRVFRPQSQTFWAIDAEGLESPVRCIDDSGRIRTLGAGD